MWNNNEKQKQPNVTPRPAGAYRCRQIVDQHLHKSLFICFAFCAKNRPLRCRTATAHAMSTCYESILLAIATATMTIKADYDCNPCNGNHNRCCDYRCWCCYCCYATTEPRTSVNESSNSAFRFCMARGHKQQKLSDIGIRFAEVGVPQQKPSLGIMEKVQCSEVIP